MNSNRKVSQQNACFLDSFIQNKWNRDPLKQISALFSPLLSACFNKSHMKRINDDCFKMGLTHGGHCAASAEVCAGYAVWHCGNVISYSPCNCLDKKDGIDWICWTPQQTFGDFLQRQSVKAVMETWGAITLDFKKKKKKEKWIHAHLAEVVSLSISRWQQAASSLNVHSLLLPAAWDSDTICSLLMFPLETKLEVISLLCEQNIQQSQ